jgi:transposase, IS5 family
LRVEKFLSTIERVIPWGALCDALFSLYRTGEGGRPAYDLILMLKIHFLQLWYNLSDPAIEEALYDRLSFQRFLGFDCLGVRFPIKVACYGFVTGLKPMIYQIKFSRL